jgi:protein subunit release factor B
MSSSVPPPLPLTDALFERLRRECELTTHTGGGPGGQHRNKTQTAVRLVHRPTGVVVTATERRSLEANKRAAFARLAIRLAALAHKPKPRTATRPSRSSVERRLQAKRARSGAKRARTRTDDD